MSLGPPLDTKGFENLRPARGYLDVKERGLSLIHGTILLPDQEIDSVHVYLDGAWAGSGAIEAEPRAGEAYPNIPHAGQSAFQVRLQPGQFQTDRVNRVSVIGSLDGRPIARLSTLLFRKGLVPNTPTPPPDKIQTVQGSRSAELYKALGFRYYHQFVDVISRYRDWRSVRRLLDFGCGSGRILVHFLRDADGPQVIGCDLDAAMIAWCRDHLPSGEFTVIEVSQVLPYADATFDAVISLAVLPAFGPDALNECLAEMRRVLAPGGLFLPSVQGRFAASYLLPPDTMSQLDRDGIIDAGPSETGEWRGFYLTRDYVLREWSKYLEVLDYLEGEINADQDLVVLRRKP
jgi:SAM-dependent methyltransferase